MKRGNLVLTALFTAFLNMTASIARADKVEGGALVAPFSTTSIACPVCGLVAAGVAVLAYGGVEFSNSIDEDDAEKAATLVSEAKKGDGLVINEFAKDLGITAQKASDEVIKKCQTQVICDKDGNANQGYNYILKLESEDLYPHSKK